MSLERAAIIASGFVVGGQLILRLITVLGTIILARVLAPSDFGIIALVVVTREIIDLVLSIGTASFLIRQKDVDLRHYSTAWTLNIARGFLAAVMIGLVAEPVAQFLEEPRLALVLVVSAAGALVSGFENTGMVLYRRELEFFKPTVQSAIAQLGSLLVTVALAFWLKSYWALVIGNFAWPVFTTISSFVLHKFRPRLSLFDVRAMLGFGVWLSVSQLVFAIAARMDSFILQKMLSTSSVGLFATARDFCATPVQQLVYNTSSVFASALSKVQGDVEREKSVYLETIAMLLTLMWPIMVGLALVSSDLCFLLFGEKWIGIEKVVAPISVMMAIQIMAANVSPVIMQSGKTSILTRRSLCYIFVRLPVFYLATKFYGLDGATAGYVAAGVVLLIIDLVIIRSLIAIRLTDYLKIAFRPFIACAVMVAAVLCVHLSTSSSSELAGRVVQLCAAVAVGVVTYVSALILAWQIAGRPAGPEVRLLKIAGMALSSINVRIMTLMAARGWR